MENWRILLIVVGTIMIAYGLLFSILSLIFAYKKHKLQKEGKKNQQ